MGNKYFDAKRDRELIAAGTHFFCQTCIVAKPANEQSPDKRYCQGCYEVLLKEAELLPAKSRRPEWIPKAGEVRQKVAVCVLLHPQLMSTLNGKNSEVDIIQPSVAKVTRGKRGPKQKPLPQELIEQWAGEGMGSKAIATKLRKEQGIPVSYKTIQRAMKKEDVKAPGANKSIQLAKSTPMGA